MAVEFLPDYTILPIWSDEPEDALYRALRAAKAKLHTDILIKPVRAVPGSPGRILAIGSAPHFACEWLGVKDLNDLQKLAHVIAWVLGIEEDNRAQGELEFFQGIFGEGVKEID